MYLTRTKLLALKYTCLVSNLQYVLSKGKISAHNSLGLNPMSFVEFESDKSLNLPSWV